MLNKKKDRTVTVKKKTVEYRVWRSYLQPVVFSLVLLSGTSNLRK